MDINALNLHLEAKRPWEAADQGLALLQRDWGGIYFNWFIITIPFILLIAIIFYFIYPPAAPYAIWWLKPWYDRIVLAYISQSIFSQNPGPKKLLSQLRSIFKTGWFSSISYFRLHPARSLALPVWQLENQKGAMRSKRMAELSRDAGSVGSWLTIGTLHLDMALTIGGLLLLSWFESDYEDNSWDMVQTLFTGDGYWLGIGIQMAIMSILEPFYVCAGFTLYLNRRTIIEGWDIELQFRKAILQWNKKQP
ncbi:MAG: hypothetical protein ACWA5R_13070 [bacterium]